MTETRISGPDAAAQAGDAVMVDLSAPAPVAPTVVDTPVRRPLLDPFVLWGAGATVAFTAAVVLISLARNDGHLIYVIDDPAIHLSVAETLVHHGTWGIVGGVFESASSAPGWTLLVAAAVGVLPRFDEWVPLVLNLAAVVLLLAVLGRSQTLLRPGRGRVLDGVVVAAIALGPLFLPGLAVTGMEHVLHAALVVFAVDRFARLEGEHARRADLWFAYGALAAASCIRFETLFLAAGLGAGLVLLCIPRLAPQGRPRPASRQVAKAVGCGLAAGIPVLVVGAVDLAMGQSFWPNSVMSKTVLGGDVGAVTRRVPGPYTVIREIGQADVLLLMLLGLAAVVLVWAWFGGPRHQVLAASAFVTTVWLHAAYAKFGWFERYQAYLIALGIYVALNWGGKLVRSAGRRPVLVAALVIIALVTPYKLKLLTEIPLATNNTYGQRFQVARFLARYYDGRPIATSELGYVSLMHDGDEVDLLGLGSHDVLMARERHQIGPDYWRRLMEQRRVEVIAAYPGILDDEEVPPEWELVGEWRQSGPRVTGPFAEFYFWAPRGAAADRLQRDLTSFQPELPDNVTNLCVRCLHELADAQANDP